MIAPGALPRLLAGTGTRPLSLADHEASFSMVAPVRSPMDELADAGLLGRGGAGFPTFAKVELLRAQRSHHKHVVVNAMEGEPAAHKDHRLLSLNPHLVLDGAEALAAMIGATKITVCVARDNTAVINHVKRAMHERQRRSLRAPALELQTPPGRYVAGEESALIHWLNDNESLPQYRPDRPTILRIGHAPVLVDNAETCAHVGLISRYGAAWYRSLGTEAHPGSTLVSVTGAVAKPQVLELGMGTPVRAILEAAGATTSPQAVLLGGYGGAWLAGDQIDVAYDNGSLAPLGLSVGAGILAVLPRDACGISEAQRVVAWMANESARQCGPCAFGLPALADDLNALVHGRRDAVGALQRLEVRCASIAGRGACRHPDGVIRFVRSTLEVFAADISRHVQSGPCAAAGNRQRFLMVPAIERAEELIWE